MSSPLLVRNVMVTRLVTLPPATDVMPAVRMLVKHHVTGAPVVTREGEVSRRVLREVLLERRDAIASTVD